MASDILYPQPTFYFQVDFGTAEMQCSEVSGLDTELEEMKYRYGSSKNFSVTKMPGLRSSGDVTVKKGVFKSDKKYWEWYNKVKLNVPERQTVTIKLLDEADGVVMTWTLANAWPKKITSPGLKADSSDVAIEEIVIAHEGCTIS
jgi:phage tail-like protein